MNLLICVTRIRILEDKDYQRLLHFSHVIDAFYNRLLRELMIIHMCEIEIYH